MVIRRLAFFAAVMLGDYFLVAFVILLTILLMKRHSARVLADRLGARFSDTLILVALQWPWLAWRALARRAR